MQRNDLLVWVDLEMTGLDPKTDAIREIATVITDSNLDVVAEGPNLVIQVPDQNLIQKMRDNVSFPVAEEIFEEIKNSPYSLADAEQQTLEFLEQYIEKGSSPLCGNTIHMDRFFLMYGMPKVIAHLHYRNIDVSTLKELARRWHPDLAEKAGSMKQKTHRAKDDIYESIEELRFYRKNFLN